MIAVAIYLAWFLLALVTIIAPSILDWKLPATTASGVWSLFLAQQLVFLFRAAITVGWWGSEVDYYERVASQELPLIADALSERPDVGMPPPDLGTQTA